MSRDGCQKLNRYFELEHDIVLENVEYVSFAISQKKSSKTHIDR